MGIDWGKVYSNAMAQTAPRAAEKKTGGVQTTTPLPQNNTVAVSVPAAAPAVGYENEMKRLQEQRRQAAVDLDTDTVNRVDEEMKRLRASAGKQTVVDRVGDVVGASAAGTVGNIANTVNTVQQLLGKQDVDHRLADTAAADSQRFTQSAKEGLGGVGQFMVDAGVAGGQLLGDAAANALVPGSGLAMMGARSFGGAAQEARQSGATVGQQVAYGAGSAAVSLLTEKLANVSGVFKGAFGSGVLDKALNRLTEKPLGKLAASAISEGGEEFLEAVAQPLLEKLTYNPNAAYDGEWLSEALYSAAIGAVLGGAGAGVDIAAAPKAAGVHNSTAISADRSADMNSPTLGQSGVQGDSGGNAALQREGLAAAQIMAQEMAGQQKTARPNKGEAAEVIKVLADSIPALKAEPIVAKSSSQAFRAVPGNTMAEKARKLFEGIQGVVVRPGFGDVEINGRSVKDDLSHGVGPAKAATIAAVPQVIQRGKQVDYQENWKGRGYDGYVFAAPVEMDGAPVYVAAVVKKTSKNRFYLHEVVDSNGNIIKIDDIESANPTSLAANGDAGTQSPSSTSDSTITYPSNSVNIVSAYMLEKGKTPPGRGKKIEGNSQLPDAQAPWFTAKTDSATIPSKSDSTIAHPSNYVNTADVADRSGDVMVAEVQRLYGQQKTAPGAGAVRVGQATILKNPYQGTTPVQNPKQNRTTPTVSKELVLQAKARISAAESGSAQGAGAFKNLLTKAYQAVFKSAKQVPVEGLTFHGAQYFVDINNGVPGKVISDVNHAPEKLALLEMLPDIVTNGEFVGSTNGKDGKKIVRYDHFETPVTIDGKPYLVLFETEVYPNVNNYKTHQLKNIELMNQSGEVTGTPPASAERTSAPTKFTIAHPADSVNTSDPLLTAMLGSQRKDDGLGAANAGSLNSDYDNLQAQSDTFHPEGANAARPVDVPTQDFDGRNIPKSASTIMGAQGIDGEDVRFLEQQIADGKLSFDTIKDADAVARAQAVMQEKGFDGALEQYRQAVSSGVATKDNTCLGQQLLLQAMKSGNVAYTAELLSLYTRNSTTAAQAMQAQSIFRKLSPEGQLVAVQKAIDALNDKYGTDVKLDEQDVADFMEAQTDEERQDAEQRMIAKAAQAVPGTFKAKFDTLRYLAMLGNMRTHIRNVLGNTLFQAPVAVKNRVGAAMEIAANTVSGGRVERTKSLFGANPFGSLAAEARADWKNVKDFLGQSSKYAESQASLQDIEHQAHAFSDSNPAGRTVNRLADFNSKALEAEDTAAKRIIYTQSLAGYLKANGVKSMKDADPALLNRARTYAANEALRNTFNDRNAVSDAVSKLGAASRSSNPVVKTAGYVVEGVLPFKRTPANILVRAAEYSPVGVGIGIFDTIRGSTKGDADAVARGLDRLAAGMTGTGMMALGVLAAGNGWVTGGEDDDDKQQAFDDLTGHQTYALELSDGTSVTLDWLAPEAIPFFMGVELCKAAENGQLTIGELGDTLKNATAPMLEMSMLQGLSDTFDNAAYAINRGESVIGSLVTSALTNYVTQVVPTLGGQMERTTEDVRMTTYTDKNSPLSSDLQYTLGKVSQKVPVWDFQQIPYIDAWGREEATGDVMERAVNNLFNPAYVSQVDVDKVETELQRLADSTGNTTVFPERAGKYITVDGVRKDLTAEEYVTYAKALGQSRYQLTQDAMTSDSYSAMSDADKADFISTMYKVAGYKAAKLIDAGYENDTLRKYAEAEDAGMSPAEYYIMRNTYDYDSSSSSGAPTQAEAQRYLDTETDLTKSQKADLWTIINQSWKKNPYK